MLVILEIKLDLVSVDTAVSVDLINSDLCAVLNCETIYSSRACDRADTADLEYFAGRCFTGSASSGCCCVSCCSGSCPVVEDELPQAVKEAAIASARLKLKTLFS